VAGLLFGTLRAGKIWEKLAFAAAATGVLTILLFRNTAKHWYKFNITQG
jgi:hypothetical protein